MSRGMGVVSIGATTNTQAFFWPKTVKFPMENLKMKNINPIFHEDENPLDVLHRVQCVLCFLKEIYAQDKEEHEISVNGQTGLFQILLFLEDTTRQIADALRKK